jgi:hypothetical protein
MRMSMDISRFGPSSQRPLYVGGDPTAKGTEEIAGKSDLFPAIVFSGGLLRSLVGPSIGHLSKRPTRTFRQQVGRPGDGVLRRECRGARRATLPWKGGRAKPV